MRILKKTSTITTIMDNVICNRCGKSCKAPGDNPNFFYADCVAAGGYGSQRFEDGHKYTFDLCEDCTIEVAKGFKHPPEVRFIGLWNEGNSPPEVTWEETVKKGKHHGR